MLHRIIYLTFAYHKLRYEMSEIIIGYAIAILRFFDISAKISQWPWMTLKVKQKSHTSHDDYGNMSHIPEQNSVHAGDQSLKWTQPPFREKLHQWHFTHRCTCRHVAGTPGHIVQPKTKIVPLDLRWFGQWCLWNVKWSHNILHLATMLIRIYL